MAAAPVAGTGGAGTGDPPGASSAWARALARPVAAPLALAAVAIAVRAFTWSRSEAIMNDGPAFLRIAWNLGNGRWSEALAHPYHPLYPLLIAAVQPLFGASRAWEVGSWETAGVAVSIASGGVAVWFLYDFLRRSFGGWVPAVGALLLAVHPYAVPYSSDVQSEGVYLALFLGAVGRAWRALEAPSFGRAAAAGLLSGLAYLTRPEGLGVAVAAVALMALLTLRGLRAPRAFGGFAAGVALGASLVVLPYVVALDRSAGELRLTRKKSLVTIATLDERSLERSERLYGLGPEPGAPESPWHKWGRRVGHGTSEVLGAARHAFRPDHWVLAGLGAWAVGGSPGLRAAFLATIVGLYGAVLFGLQLTAGYVSMRHALPPLVPLLGYVALGVPVLGRGLLALPRLALRRGPPTPGVALATGLAVVMVASTVMATRPQRPERAAARAASEWLGAQGLAEEVAATKQRDAYYALAHYARLPRSAADGGGADWVESLRQRGVRYIILDEAAAREYPGLGDEGRVARDARLRVLHRVEAGDRWAVVLEVTEAPTPTE